MSSDAGSARPDAQVHEPDLQLALRVAADLRRELEARNAELHEANEHLVLAAMRASDMADAATHAEERRRRMEEFLAMLAHELRNPLAPISTATAILDRAAAADPTVKWVQGVLQRQLVHLTRLLDDLLDASRVTRGKIALKREPVLLGDLIEAAVDEVRPLVSERNQELSVTLPADRITVNGDLVRLTQVVCNVLHNASKFTPAQGHIELHAQADADNVTIRVTDDGAGISPATLDSVFDLFAQGDDSLSRSAGGLGIGLTVVKSIVDLHRGAVSAKSEGLGTGSEFTIVLPAAGAAAPSDTKPAEAPVATTVGRRIAVIDDNVDATSALAILLELAGHDVSVAHNGLEGVSLVLTEKPEIVICDIGLPGIDGYEVAQRIRAKLDPPPVLLAMTGYGHGDDQNRSLSSGFAEHLVKPVDPKRLLQIIDDHCALASAGAS